MKVDSNGEEDDDEGWVMEQNNIGVPDMFEAHEDLHADEPEIYQDIKLNRSKI